MRLPTRHNRPCLQAEQDSLTDKRVPRRSLFLGCGIFHSNCLKQNVIDPPGPYALPRSREAAGSNEQSAKKAPAVAFLVTNFIS